MQQTPASRAFNSTSASQRLAALSAVPNAGTSTISAASRSLISPDRFQTPACPPASGPFCLTTHCSYKQKTNRTGPKAAPAEPRARLQRRSEAAQRPLASPRSGGRTHL